jgi:hypothetical protein
MKVSFISAGACGLLGIVILFGIWMTGLPPHHFWLLFLWPSQLVGMGTDGVSIVPELILQFFIYGVIGFIASFLGRLARSE